MNNKTIENIQERLLNLSFPKQLAFSYFLWKRLFPNYIAFYKTKNWGDPEVLQNTAAELENAIITQNPIESEKITDELKKATPDTDDFVGFLTSLALDTCAVLLEAISFSQDKDEQRLVDISTSALDLTQMYIEFRDDADFDEYAFDEPLLVEEIAFQSKMIETLENQSDVTDTFLEQTEIEKSKLGSLITDIPLSELDYQPEIYSIKATQLDSEIRAWIKNQNIDINEVLPELIKGFYFTSKKAYKIENVSRNNAL